MAPACGRWIRTNRDYWRFAGKVLPCDAINRETAALVADVQSSSVQAIAAAGALWTLPHGGVSQSQMLRP